MSLLFSCIREEVVFSTRNSIEWKRGRPGRRWNEAMRKVCGGATSSRLAAHKNRLEKNKRGTVSDGLIKLKKGPENINNNVNTLVVIFNV